jgi:hypothetical protein
MHVYINFTMDVMKNDTIIFTLNGCKFRFHEMLKILVLFIYVQLVVVYNIIYLLLLL